MKNIVWFKDLTIKEVPKVGGKNASLGEMYSQLTKKGINIPNGFALTTNIYWSFIKTNKIDKKLKEIFKEFNPDNLDSLLEVGRLSRDTILKGKFSDDLKKEIISAYFELSKKYGQKMTDVAVRSSGVAEDSPKDSFAGQFETYLNICGKEELLLAIKKCFASAFNDRVIAYRQKKGIPHLKFALSVGVQKMVRSDLASSGIMFTLDTETGFPDVVLINSIWGVGEMIVKGNVTPDEFYVFKPTLKKGFRSIIVKDLGTKTKKYIYSSKSGGLKEINVNNVDQLKFSLTDEEILTLARWGCIIEDHYSTKLGKWMPQDIEWAKDGKTKELFIVQSRPETVHASKEIKFYEEYKLQTEKKPILTGIAVGNKIGQGKVRVISDVSKIGQFQKGEVLVTKMTDPDWVTTFPFASAIITNEGGKTCFSGDTKILTDKKLLSIKEIIERFQKEEIKILSLNEKTLKLEWKKVVDGFQRKAPSIQIEVSQTGRMRNNILKVTPDHKFLTFSNRKLVSEEIQDIIRTKKGILSILKIPSQASLDFSPQLGYLLGAISTDGHVVYKKYNKKFSSQIFFIQKPTGLKKEFIEKVKKYFQKEYSYSLHALIKPPSGGVIRGKKIKGTGAIALKCYKKEIVRDFLEKQRNLSNILLKANEEFIFNFLAGVIDGDGTYNQKANRINIFCSKNELLEAIIIACLRVGVSFQLVENRTIYNIQIVDKIEEIFKYTSRVKGEYERVKFGTRFFVAKQLLEDVIEKVNYKGRIAPYVKNNLLIDAEKIRDYVIPLIKGQPENHNLTKIINSPLKMLRVNLKSSLESKNVYNIEVEDNHNYVVFTNRYTPVVVLNCHAAIVSRELGVPCIVGTEIATKILKTGQPVTVDCSQGQQGRIFSGKISYDIKKYNLKTIPDLKTKIMVNIGAPEIAFKSSFLPNDGVGLAREEFIIAEKIKVHPLALYYYKELKNLNSKFQTSNKFQISSFKIQKIIKRIEEITIEHQDKKEFFIKELAEGIAKIAAAFYPKEVIVRFSDFKTNEYRNLIGGELFEPEEENPMLGWRGASRYYDKQFRPAFEMECQAIKRVREVFGLKNISVMVPFCRTPEEGARVLEIIKQQGLGYSLAEKKSEKDLKIYVMCEIPSNVILADKFLDIFDGMSIGSNDLAQLVLGMDRDNAKIAPISDERNEAVKEMIKKTIELCKKRKKYCGICGQAPSDYPEFAEFLVKNNIESISLNPDTVLKTILMLSKKRNIKP
ncbi:MAG: phosphoenolpyruvate synthase [Candidatus Liptonbacteria bacterium]|nr:phosphoenolpyruvate synthase [Candidatus Liptonbacteria bacterium]